MKIKILELIYRLKIIDLSNRGNQPMFDASKRYLINFNGEIYNAKKLLKYLPILN